jgi:maltooligosyltrehalose trehalohydrolase
MGEEYGETAPFQYFTSHSDKDLIEAVRKGRLEEFDDFVWHGEPPDPHAEETFQRSKLNWDLTRRDKHAAIRRLYQQLLQLRRDTPALRSLDLDAVETHADDARQVLFVRRHAEKSQVLIGFNFSDKPQTMDLPFARASWKAMIDTGAAADAGRVTLPPHSFALWVAD